MHHPLRRHLTLAALHAWVLDGAMAHLGRGFFSFPPSFWPCLFSGSNFAKFLPVLFAPGFCELYVVLIAPVASQVCALLLRGVQLRCFGVCVSHLGLVNTHDFVAA
jgi:hypothetical protein